MLPPLDPSLLQVRSLLLSFVRCLPFGDRALSGLTRLNHPSSFPSVWVSCASSLEPSSRQPGPREIHRMVTPVAGLPVHISALVHGRWFNSILCLLGAALGTACGASSAGGAAVVCCLVDENDASSESLPTRQAQTGRIDSRQHH